MSAELKQIDVPDARFTCASCGRCCSTTWAVTLDRAKVKALRKHDWSHLGAGDPFMVNDGPGGEFRLRMVDGRCVFLGDDKLCRIHAEVGYDEKPESCKAFPLQFASSQGVTHARFSFYCPTVTRGDGKKLADQMKWVRAAARATNIEERGSASSLEGTVALERKDFAALHAALMTVSTSSTPLAERLAACAGVLRSVVSAVMAAVVRTAAPDAAPRVTVEEAARMATSMPVSELARLGRADGVAAGGWSVVSLYLSADAPRNTAARVLQLLSLRLSAVGLARHRSAFLGAKVSGRSWRRVRLSLEGDGGKLIERYLHHKLSTRAYLSGVSSVTQGVNLLFAALGTAAVIARMSAAKAGRTETAAQDIAAGVEAADFLVLEHATIAQAGGIGVVVNRLLADATLSASLLAFARFEDADAVPAQPQLVASAEL